MITNLQRSLLETILKRPILDFEINRAVLVMENAVGVKVTSCSPHIVIEMMASKILGGSKCLNK